MAPSHVYPIISNDLTWAPKQACGHINNGIPAPIYYFYESVSLVLTSFCLDKRFVFISWIDQWARKVSRTGEKPYCDPWRRLLLWELKGFTCTNQHEKKQQCHTGWERPKWPFRKATWKYYDCVRKSFPSFWQAQPAQQGSIVCPVQRGGNPPGETCFHQRADKWYELWSLCLGGGFAAVRIASLHCSGLDLRGELPTVLTQTAQRFLTDRSHQIISHFPCYIKTLDTKI